MMNLKKIYFVLFSMVGLVACEADIDLDIQDATNKIVVIESLLRDNTLNPNDQQLIKVTQTTSYYNNNDDKSVNSATVELLDNSANPVLFTQHPNSDSSDYYVLPPNYSFTIGHTYQLNVTVGDQTYSAESELKFVPILDTLEFFINEIQFLFASPQTPIAEEDTTFDIFTGFIDNPEIGDYYLFNYYVNGELASVNPRDKQIIGDEGFDGWVQASIIQFNNDRAVYGDTITLEMLSSSKEVSDFYNIMFTQTDLSGNPFAGGPPANVPTNFSNGARGIFQVSSASRNTAIFKRNLYP